MPWLRALGLVLLASACSAPREGPLGEASATLDWSARGERAFEIRADGERLGAWRPEGRGGRLVGAVLRAALRVEEEPLGAAPYPRRVRRDAVSNAGGAAFRDEYTLLAPPAPLDVEGLGLAVAEDEPGTNDAEHERLRAWLRSQGLPADSAPFEALHRAETGRELRVWYEISGRRRDGRLLRTGASAPLARSDSLFRSEAGELKIHHKRPGENGRFFYHRRSLELADRIAAAGAPPLVAHECGCYGYAIAADFTTLGEKLYRVEADWLDDRVGAEFFLGLERRSAFPWLGRGERRRMRDLARRARAWQLRDAHGVLFAEVALELPADPPRGALGAIAYRIDHVGADDARRPLARITHGEDGISLAFFGADLGAALEQLDRLLAAMPVQVMRGDGIRDSQLGEIEQLVDAVRLLEEPSDERLADLASELDAASAARKVEALLAAEPARFAARAGEHPPDPIAGPGLGETASRAAD
jgi:hypothetical protein